MSDLDPVQEDRAGLRSHSPEPLVLALCVLALGITLLLGALSFEGGNGYQAIGPGIFPLTVGGITTLTGLALVTSAARAWIRPTARTDASPANWKNVLLLAALLVTYVIALIPVGFWQLTGLVYAAAARIFGSRRPVRDLLIGYALALTAYFLFDRLLAVGLPDGYFRIAG